MILVITIIMITVQIAPTITPMMAALLLLSQDSTVGHDNTTCDCSKQAVIMTK